MIPLQTASTHPVTHILFSSDGSAVAVAQPHYGVTLLERGTGRALAVCAMPRRPVLTGLTFCGDGKYLAAAHMKGLEVFDAERGTRVAVSLWSYFKEMKLAERDGIAYGLGSGIAGPVWHPDAPRDIQFRWGSLSNRSTGSMTLSPDARFALEAVPGPGLKLHDLSATRCVAKVERPGGSAERAAVVARFCPLSRRFAINDGRTLDVYDAGGLAGDDEYEQRADTPLVQRANGTMHAAGAIAVAPMPHVGLAPAFTLTSADRATAGWYPPFALAADGRGLLVKRPRNRIQLWDTPTGALVHEWSWRLEWVTCVAVSGDGLTAVAGGRFGRVLLWDLE